MDDVIHRTFQPERSSAGKRLQRVPAPVTGETEIAVFIGNEGCVGFPDVVDEFVKGGVGRLFAVVLMD